MPGFLNRVSQVRILPRAQREHPGQRAVDRLRRLPKRLRGAVLSVSCPSEIVRLRFMMDIVAPVGA